MGAALASQLQVPHVDVDDYYWYPTQPPFVRSRPPADRVGLIRQSLADHWVLSGSMDDWGDEVIQDAELVVFIDTPTAIRMQRLKARELQRYGQRILPGGDMYANHLAFLSWAEGYETGAQPGRSRPRHERWLKQLTQPRLRLAGDAPVAQLLAEVMVIVQLHASSPK